MTVQYSIQKMVSDGTLSTIALGIQYLQRNDIYIRIAGEETPQSGAPSGYTWSFVNNTTLRILPVVPNGVEVVVYRRTDVDAMYNIYSQNAQFDEATIDENNQQLLYIAQEYLEQGIPGAGVDTIEFLRDDGSFTYYRIKRTDGSYSDEFAVPSAGSATKILALEALRRSCTTAGFNLIAGSFEVGGTFVNNTDVLLQESTGKVYSGPTGTVVAGTDPASGGGFVDRGSDLVYQFKTVADMKSNPIPSSAFNAGVLRAKTASYYPDISGGGAEYLITTLTTARALKDNPLFVPDGWGDHYLFGGTTYVALLSQKDTVSARSYGLRGDYVTDDKPALVAMWDSVAWGSKIEYGVGCFKIVDGHTHPLKQLIHEGAAKAPTFVPSASDIRGTSFYFPTKVGVNKGGIYMPPPAGGKWSRHSMFKDFTFFGDGTNDDNGTVTTLKINNLGTSLQNVDFRYGAIGIETNYMVGSSWDDVFAFGSKHGLLFVYDPVTPFGLEKNSVATQNKFGSVGCATSTTNTSASGLMIDATCNFGGNDLGCLDLESCYVGAIIEGRVAAKDHDGQQAYGAAAWKGSGSTVECLWFERNTADNLMIIFDVGSAQPALSVRNLFEDVIKRYSSGPCELFQQTATGGRVLIESTLKDAPQGKIGNYGSPFTANQFLLHGPEINSPLTRSIMREAVPVSYENRLSRETKSSFDFDAIFGDFPPLASTVNVCNVDLKSPTKTAIITYTLVATSNTGEAYATDGCIIVEMLKDAITYTNLRENYSGASKQLTLKPLRVATNTFGVYVYKEAAISAQVVSATLSCKIVVSGSSVGTFSCAVSPRF